MCRLARIATIIPSTLFRPLSRLEHWGKPHATVALGYLHESIDVVFCSPSLQNQLSWGLNGGSSGAWIPTLENDPESLFLVSLRSVSRFFSTGTFWKNAFPDGALGYLGVPKTTGEISMEKVALGVAEAGDSRAHTVESERSQGRNRDCSLVLSKKDLSSCVACFRTR
jgi:hypothetical protein